MRAAQVSDIGRERSRNEDACLADPDRGLFVVADGLGGHAAGDVASHRTIQLLDGALTGDRLGVPDGRLLEEFGRVLVEANEEVVAEAEADPSKRGMGTTVVLAHLAPDERLLTLAHIGDSRAYLLRDGGLRRITEDHVYDGAFGRTLTQAVGANGGVDPDTVEVELEPGDRILLCTDGLTDMLADEEIREILAEGRPPEDCCDALLDRALARGGHDNVTTIVIDVDG